MAKNSTVSLNELLENKSLYYDKIDYAIIKKSWDILEQHIKLPFIIHIIGTNGKGSSGRFLSHYLYKKGFNTLHYSSPHILKFNERIWINGLDVSDDVLENSHQKLQGFLPDELLDKLTYFEYTTLLAFLISSGFDYLVLEAGLGGEFDATNVVKNDLTLVTKIGLDHQSFLGNTIKEIASTKLRSCDNKMIVSQQDYGEVYEIAKEYDYKLTDNFDTASLEFPKYLKENLNLVLTALQELKIKIDLELFKDVKLFGRCQKIASNITIDVGHNPLAAKVIFEEFKNKKVKLIYNSYADKDYKEVLTILKPIIDELLLIEIDDKRVAKESDMLGVLDELNIKYSKYITIDEKFEYLVFGSFSVVEKFLLGYLCEK